MQKLLQTLGLDPLVAFTVVAIDTMLFVPDASGAGWFISLMVATLLVIPVIIMQRFSYHDSWRIAFAKGIIIGILTAIPTPLPSIATAAFGIAGLISLLREGGIKRLIPNEQNFRQEKP